MTRGISLVFFLLTIPALADQAYHASLRFGSIPDGAKPAAFAADASGNLFIVSYITAPSGKQQIRVDKNDPNGKALASIEFGGSASGSALIFQLFGSPIDTVAGAAVDPGGNLVIAGTTYASDFPLVSPLVQTNELSSGFITKIDSQLRTILFSTKFGGSRNAFGETGIEALALDKSGNIYVTGSTNDSDFPTTPGAFQTSIRIYASYAFLTEIASNGKATLASTYFGDGAVLCSSTEIACPASAYTIGSAIALDPAGNVVIAGSTSSNSLPVTPGVFGPTCGDCGTSEAGYEALAGFVAKFSTNESQLLWATYVPVVAAPASYCTDVQISSLAFDVSGNVIAAGTTSSVLPVTAGALLTAVPISPPGEAGFVMKFDAAVQHLLFSTYFGGSGDLGRITYGSVSALAVDPQSVIWITGASPQDQLPAVAGTTLVGQTYLAGLSSDGSTLLSLFTAPSGIAGVALVITAGGVTSLGEAGALLTASPGQGPSLISVQNSAGDDIANGVAPFELISLHGLGLGPQMPVGAQVANGVVGNLLGGVQVLFDGAPAPLLSVGSTEIDAIVPYKVSARDSTQLQIVTPSGRLDGPMIQVRASKPGVFLSRDVSISGLPVAAALNQDGSVNSASNPAALGSIVSVWVSGAGMSTLVVADGTIRGPQAVGSTTLPVAAFSGPVDVIPAFLGDLPGSLSLEVFYAGDSAGMVSGVCQVNFRLPATVEFGVDYIGFWLQIGDAQTESFTLYLKTPQ